MYPLLSQSSVKWREAASARIRAKSEPDKTSRRRTDANSVLFHWVTSAERLREAIRPTPAAMPGDLPWNRLSVFLSAPRAASHALRSAAVSASSTALSHPWRPRVLPLWGSTPCKID